MYACNKFVQFELDQIRTCSEDTTFSFTFSNTALIWSMVMVIKTGINEWSSEDVIMHNSKKILHEECPRKAFVKVFAGHRCVN